MALLVRRTSALHHATLNSLAGGAHACMRTAQMHAGQSASTFHSLGESLLTLRLRWAPQRRQTFCVTLRPHVL